MRGTSKTAKCKVCETKEEGDQRTEARRLKVTIPALLHRLAFLGEFFDVIVANTGRSFPEKLE